MILKKYKALKIILPCLMCLFLGAIAAAFTSGWQVYAVIAAYCSFAASFSIVFYIQPDDDAYLYALSAVMTAFGCYLNGVAALFCTGCAFAFTLMSFEKAYEKNRVAGFLLSVAVAYLCYKLFTCYLSAFTM